MFLSMIYLINRYTRSHEKWVAHDQFIMGDTCVCNDKEKCNGQKMR